MREMSFKQQTEIRERVRQEYDDLIQNLFNSTFQLKNKFDEFRGELHDDVFEKINDTRREAFKCMSTVRQKYSNKEGQLFVKVYKKVVYFKVNISISLLKLQVEICFMNKSAEFKWLVFWNLLEVKDLINMIKKSVGLKKSYIILSIYDFQKNYIVWFMLTAYLYLCFLKKITAHTRK